MATSINKLTNCNVYLNGGSLLGKAKEVTLPTVTQKMVDHEALGMAGTVQVPAGVEAMEATILWNSFYPDTAKLLANPTKALSFMIRGNLESWGPTGRTAETPFKVYMTGTVSAFPTGTFTQKENVEAETTVAVYQVKMEIGSEVIMEFDAMANIYKVAGQDILQNYRINLGI